LARGLRFRDQGHRPHPFDDQRPAGGQALIARLTAITVVFLVTGAALSTVPIFVGQELRLGPEVIGLISGAQFVAAVISRLGAGRYSDRAGSKKAVAAGLIMSIAAALIYVCAYRLRASVELSAGVLLIGRALLGGAESFIIIGAQTWALAIAGPLRAAQVIGWAGTALFTALALGAPLGRAIYSLWALQLAQRARSLWPAGAKARP
jgi:MFS family permease